MRYRLLLASMFLWGAALAVQGQVPVKRPRVPSPRVPGASAASSPVDATTAAAGVGLLGSARGGGPLLAVATLHAGTRRAAGPASPRMARLGQLQFDRRPSTILKVWSDRPEAKAGAPKGPAKAPLDVELEAFQKNVTLGRWPAVKAYLAGLPSAEGKAAYRQMLQSLQGMPGMLPGVPGMPRGSRGLMIRGPDGSLVPMNPPERNALTAEDVIGLVAAAPGGLDKPLAASLGAILRQALEGQTVAQDVVARFKSEADRGAGKAALTTRQAAQVFMAAGEPVAAGTFLPGLDQAVAAKDSEGLNLLARHFLGVHASEKKAVFLERAWSATQAVLAVSAGKVEEKEEALKRAVELASKIKEELGQAWLDQTFTSHPERGMEILATIGSLASQGMDTNPIQRDERLKVLQLQKTAVEALLKAAPQRAAQWRSTLTLLAGGWMREAEYTKRMDSTGGQRMVRRGRVTYFYGDPDELLRMQNQPLPIHTADLLHTRPEKGWLASLDAGPRAKLSALLAHLYLKANEEQKAFPFIEELAPTNKEAARALVNEFLGVWTTNHDPNAARQDNFNPYVYGYGGFASSGNADSIPLTRSKQERNLVDLAGWVERLRRLPLDRLDEDLLVNAFTRCHSRAEVYRLEKIEMIFGPLAKIKPRTLATLIQTTRSNLAGQWRMPAEQQKQKTNRKQKDMQVEMLRGYALAGTVVADALKQFPDDWSLNLARAALLHDETNYHQEVAKTSDFSKKRAEALAAFQKAAALYSDQVRKLAEDEETIAVFQLWFNASLGACDLEQVDDEKLPDLKQVPLIRKALLALPAEVAERHMKRMAESLAANLGVVRPTARYRYLKQGLAIAGDHKEAAGAKKIFDYYKDLVTEIKLDVVLDGSDRVGHQQPFGIFVNIRHTREIEREAGGFGRFLQNASPSSPFGYVNPGRPTADYRERFQAAATEALKEQFEIVSITFQSDKVNSRALPEYGWRVTPYAYLLLKPRGPQVDKIPPLHIDLDFQDTSAATVDFSNPRPAVGYVILPIESPAVPIDATSASGAPRPVRKLQITQILDERQADKGKLRLEIKASGVGLVGAFDNTLDLHPEGFEVVKVEDPGVSVAKFDDDGDSIAVVSERNWLVELRASQDRASAPTIFRFATPRIGGADMAYQRYRDVDLVAAEPEAALENQYQGRSTGWLWAVGAASVALVVVGGLVLLWVLRRRPRVKAGTTLPAMLTPFTVTVLLRRIRQAGTLSPTDKEALDGVIGKLEDRYFAGTDGNGEIDLRALAEDWVRRVG